MFRMMLMLDSKSGTRHCRLCKTGHSTGMIPARSEDEAHVSGVWVGAGRMKGCGTEPWHKAVHLLEHFVLHSIDVMCDPALQTPCPAAQGVL